MVSVSAADLRKKAREINDSIFGGDRKGKVALNLAIKKSVEASALFALEKTLSKTRVSEGAKSSFVDIIRGQPDAINLLFASEQNKAQAIEMLKPLFGYKTKQLLGDFQKIFLDLQREIQEEKKVFRAG
ncbi:MAG: hypothetical protein AABW99_05105 [archaeon]